MDSYELAMIEEILSPTKFILWVTTRLDFSRIGDRTLVTKKTVLVEAALAISIDWHATSKT